MITSEIRFKVELDEKKIPEKIFWTASDSDSLGLTEAKAMSVAVWDHLKNQTLRIDLWSKDMPIDDMKRFYIDMVGGLATSLRDATGDEFMASQMEELCDKMADYLLSK